MNKLSATLFGLLLFQANAFAQIMEKTFIVGEALQYSKMGNFEGCGVNFRFLEDSKNLPLNYATYSINFYTDNLSVALTKVTYSKMLVANPKPQLQRRRVESSWIRINKSDPLPMLKTTKGEEDSVLGIADSYKSINFLAEVLEGNSNIQLGVREQGKSAEVIMYGSVQVKDDDKILISNCFRELVDRSKK